VNNGQMTQPPEKWLVIFERKILRKIFGQAYESNLG
jgi:hypothetical protein